jgi:ATP-dependent Clp protease ATP-binding subunit ClpA
MQQETVDAEYRPAGEIEPTVALVPVPQEHPIVANLKVEGAAYLEYAQAATVTDLDTAKRATNDIALIKDSLKLIESLRKGFKAPVIEKGKEIDRFFEVLAEPFNQADRAYTGKVLAYNREEERKRQEAIRLQQLREEQARIEREQAERKEREEREKWEREQQEAREIAEALNEPPPAPTPPPAPIFVEPPKPVEIPDQQKRVRAEVGTVSFTWVLDKDKVQSAINAGVRQIPGIHIYPVWEYKVEKLALVPEEYKKPSTRVTR